MFDTHCHLNFKAFHKVLPEVISRATDAGVTHIVVPGTDIKTSKKAVEIASENGNIYAAVGIHPHHVYKLIKNEELRITNELNEIEELLHEERVGEKTTLMNFMTRFADPTSLAQWAIPGHGIEDWQNWFSHLPIDIATFLSLCVSAYTIGVQVAKSLQAMDMITPNPSEP